MSTKMKAKLLVIHVFDYPTMLDHLSLEAEDPFPDIEGETHKKHNAKLTAFSERVLNTSVATINIEIESIENKSVVKGIIKKANEINALLIVIGIKGLSEIREIIMGSTAKNLIENAPCPVLTIPNNVANTQIKTIIYATDFEDEDFGAINELVEIVKPFNAKIKILHISPLDKTIDKSEKKEIEAKIHEHIVYPNLELDILYSNDAFKTLKSYFGTSNADLIAMLERRSSSFSSKVFHRDLVKRLESYGKIPLLSFNSKNYGIFHLE
jgi:nucleotide-binding universal stress UspA family protein